MMNEHHFWRLLHGVRRRVRTTPYWEQLRRKYGITETECLLAKLRTELETLDDAGIAGFHAILRALHERACRWELWTGLAIVLDGADEFQFHECVSWLVLQGRRGFRRVLREPDRLAEAGFDESEATAAGALVQLAPGLLRARHGERDPEVAGELEERLGLAGTCLPPAHQRPAQTVPELRRRYPRLTARFLAPTLSTLDRPLIVAG